MDDALDLLARALPCLRIMRAAQLDDLARLVLDDLVALEHVAEAQAHLAACHRRAYHTTAGDVKRGSGDGRRWWATAGDGRRQGMCCLLYTSPSPRDS